MSPASEQHVQSGPQAALLESRLGRMTAHLYAWSETIPALREAVGGRTGLERILARAEHVFLPTATGELHLEVHAADPSAPAAIVLVPGIGSHARFYSGALGALCRSGIHTIIGLDRPGMVCRPARGATLPSM